MKAHFTLDDNDQIFEKLKNKANCFLKKGNLERSCYYVETAASWAYRQSLKFFDKDLEVTFREVSQIIGLLPRYNYEQGRLVFVCSRMGDNCELVQQYTRAIIASKRPTLMIVIDQQMALGYQGILKEIESSDNVKLQLVKPSGSYLDTALEIAHLIYDFRPEYILQHFVPWEVKCLLGVTLIQGAKKINIDINDHTFWLGASFLDYCIEFRPYGDNVAIKRRGLKTTQLRRLRFYPVCDESVEFQGFPFEKDSKIVIFSGGSYYKLRGNDGMFFKIADRLLDENPRAVLLLACGSKNILKDVEKLNNASRVYVSSFRKDIFSLFKHIDIYLSSFPIGGGLMVQLAGVAKKPILSFITPNKGIRDVNGMFSDKKDFNVERASLDDMCSYAQELCNNVDFRLKEGERLSETVQSRESFEKEFTSLFTMSRPLQSYDMPINDDEIREFYCNFNNDFFDFSYLIEAYGSSVIIKYPRYMIEIVNLYARRYAKQIINDFKKRNNKQ